MDVLPGENETIVSDSARHFRSRVLHVVDFDYESARSFQAGSWPTYVLADAEGQVVAQILGLGRWTPGMGKLYDALTKVAAGSAKPNTASGTQAVCENGICRIVPADGVDPPVRELEPAAVVGPGGAVWIAFTSDREGDANVYLRRDPGKETSGKILADIPVTKSMADDFAPALAAEADGRLWIAWVSNRTAKYDVYLRSFDGKDWGRELRVTESADDAMRPSVAVDGDGRVWVTYYKWNMDFGTSRDRDVFARWFRGDEASPEIRVSPAEPAIEDHADPVVVADPAHADRVWIAWSWDYHPSVQGGEPLDTDQPSIFAVSVDAAGAVGAPLHVGTPGEAQHAIDLWPSLAFDPAGVLWCVYDVGLMTRWQRGALVSHLDGDTFTAPDRLHLTKGEFSYPTLAIDDAGTKTVAWTARIDGLWQLRATRDVGQGWSKPLELFPGPTDRRAPRVVTNAQGTWIVYVEREGLDSRVCIAALE